MAVRTAAATTRPGGVAPGHDPARRPDESGHGRLGGEEGWQAGERRAGGRRGAGARIRACFRVCHPENLRVESTLRRPRCFPVGDERVPGADHGVDPDRRHATRPAGVALEAEVQVAVGDHR